MNIRLAFPFSDDIQELYELIDANREHLSNLVWAETATFESTRDYVTKTVGTEFFRLIMVDDKIAGVITLRPLNTCYLIGYWVGKEFCGKGVATKAVSIMMKSSIAQQHHVYAHIRQTNRGSKAILTRNGFKEFDFIVTNGDEVWNRLVRYPCMEN